MDVGQPGLVEDALLSRPSFREDTQGLEDEEDEIDGEWEEEKWEKGSGITGRRRRTRRERI